MLCQIVLAGTRIEIESEYQTFEIFSREYTVKQDLPAFTVLSNRAEWVNEWQIPSDFVVDDDTLHHSGVEPILETRSIYRKIFDALPSYQTIWFHSAVVVREGFAYAFTAPSGTGKSTRANLFLQRFPGSFILNGDKPLLRIEDDRVVACGSPWTGKERQGVNAEAPLKAIFLLERADETELTELKMKDAFDFLLHQTYLPKDGKQMLKTLELVKSMDGKVKLFRYRSEPTEESVEAAWRATNQD